MIRINRSKEEICEAIKKVLAEMFSEGNVNCWQESRERPISRILQENGLQSNYCCAVISVLKNENILKTENRGVMMRYFVDSSTIPDLDTLADKIYRNFYDRQKQRREFEGYPEGKSSDLQPKRVTTRKDKACNTVIISKKELRLLDKAFVMYMDTIHEGVIVGMRYDEEKQKTLYNVKIVTGEYETGALVYSHVETLHPFQNIDGIIFSLKKNMVKYATK